MRNNLLLGGALVLLLGGYFLFVYDRDDTSLPADEVAFAVEDTAAISRIVLTRYVQGEAVARVQLDRNETGWTLDGKYAAFLPRVRQMLKALHLLHLKEVLHDQGLETAGRLLETVHTRVQLYDEAGKRIKTLRVGTQTKDARGTLMQIEGADQPYVVELPGLQGYVNAYFPMETDLWRENLLFIADSARIQELAISYPDASSSFVLRRPAPGAAWRFVGREQAPDTARLAAYFASFTGRVYAESFAEANYPGMMAKLQTQDPDIVFSVSYFEGETRRLRLYDRSDNLNGFFGWIEGEDELLTIQHFVFDKYLIQAADLLGPAL
ncbi:MAG: hypothetical protein D6722_15835 [Bacteroidetes bacterium]|nr:MAG: hypothetical protein D6722_15835 [Bacteroidota bacterium]